MAPWFAVVVPAVVVALAIRLDSVLIGPYFSISSVVAGMVGVEDRFWNDGKNLKHAVIRRFFYPFILGVVLALSGLTLFDTTSAGALAAALLLWPAVFHPLPAFISLRDWQVIVIWLTFFASFGALAALGSYAVEIIYSASDGAVLDYVVALVRDAVLLSIGTTFILAFFKGSFGSLRSKVESRQARAYNLEKSDDGP
ncbi:hypothetical protein LGT39_10455 [Demequina sp. TTPB684]|uniref:hypothetical protein n=1 Tax=unclassified Demequina TaxID=2620311 RepID=UPI001CF3D54B|nr:MULTISPECIES: hypothetical protein [unclassified Demequina]MCB2413263.1 hypothetical protein [Demequina sp. TTPB684]UPU88723.1 hypothetical protein LGT36_002025 [Demequina sp. TMPB413]